MLPTGKRAIAPAPAVVREATGSEPLVFSWVKYDAYNSESMRFAKTARDQGVEAAIQQFDAALKNGSISEDSVNSLGYRFLGKKRFADAIRIFKLNTDLRPRSANTYDSLAEAYMDSGDKPLAIQVYEQSLVLNPTNSNATAQLKKLKSTTP